MAISLAAVGGLAEYLGTPVMQVLILVVFPLAAVIISLATNKTSKVRWMIALAGTGLMALAILASMRNP